MKRLLLFFIFILILGGCSKNEDIQSKNKQLEEKNKEINNLIKENEKIQELMINMETDLTYKKEETDFYKKLIEEIIKDYDDAELKVFAKRFWEYRLEVNGVAVPKNGN